MIFRKALLSKISFLSVSILLILVSCEKFKGDQTIPAYLHIDSITLSTDDYAIQGSASHNITDAWVYVDDDLVGAFELPATLPVLKEGNHTVTIYAGIKKNGIATTRANYPFFEPIVQTLNLVPDSTLSMGLLTAIYEPETDFPWREDFDDDAISLDTTSRSMVNIEPTPVGSPLTFEGQHSGEVNLDSANDFFECATHLKYSIPFAPVYLEMNFRTTNRLTIGVYVYSGFYVYEVPIMTLFSSDDVWKKIYIDLSTTLNSYYGATFFRVYFGTFKEEGNEPTRILLDNFKLVTRES
jgi:hypothetical protein